MTDREITDTLWCVNITGPDDVVAVASRQQAISAAMWFNQWWITNIANKGLHPYDPTMWAVPIPWPYDAASHAANLAKRGEPEYGAVFAASIPSRQED
jgi:hypothetical protein